MRVAVSPRKKNGIPELSANKWGFREYICNRPGALAQEVVNNKQQNTIRYIQRLLIILRALKAKHLSAQEGESTGVTVASEAQRPADRPLAISLPNRLEDYSRRPTESPSADEVLLGLLPLLAGGHPRYNGRIGGTETTLRDLFRVGIWHEHR
jgi:hypothetical protein